MVLITINAATAPIMVGIVTLPMMIIKLGIYRLMAKHGFSFIIFNALIQNFKPIHN
jgi:uncharacterized membrane protein YvlD (DUF360 family)